jgi:hypothetical protein
MSAEPQGISTFSPDRCDTVPKGHLVNVLVVGIQRLIEADELGDGQTSDVADWGKTRTTRDTEQADSAMWGMRSSESDSNRDGKEIRERER